MRDILVHAARVESWNSAVRYACALASSLRAPLTALHCAEAEPQMGSADRGPIAVDRIPAADTVQAAWAKEEAFGAYAGSLGVGHAAWVVHDGPAAKALAHLAQWHDLVVLGQGDAALHPEATLGRLQLVAHAPCLVVPEAWDTASSPACAMVVWDGSSSSVRALHAAVSVLERAGRVVLLMAGKHGALSIEPGLPPFDLDRYCGLHELETEHVALDGECSGEAVLGHALAAGADLLVMAAHGRTRMSSRLLDHRTQHVLRYSPIPLLLRN